MENQLILVLQESLQMVFKRGRIYFVYIPIRSDGENYECLSFSFNHKPTIQEIGERLNVAINVYIEDKILNGYSWNSFQVYLSKENQMTYKMLYDYSKETQILPTLKFGNTSDAVLYDFKTADELDTFYKGMVEHIYTTLKEGWTFKNFADWKEVENLLQSL